MLQAVPLLFWDVDTQVDFMREDGKLYVPEAESLDENLATLTELAREHHIPVVASADDHRPEDDEISDDPDFKVTYPPHCMTGTPGAERVEATHIGEAFVVGHEELSEEELAEGLAQNPPQVLILKNTTNVFSNPNAEEILERLDPQRVVVYGVALDICNRRAVEGLWSRGYRNLAVVVDATKPIDPALGEELLESWRERGIDLVTTEQVVDEVTGEGD